MITTPPPGFSPYPMNQQSNALLGLPGVQGAPSTGVAGQWPDPSQLAFGTAPAASPGAPSSAVPAGADTGFWGSLGLPPAPLPAPGSGAPKLPKAVTDPLGADNIDGVVETLGGGKKP